MLLDQLSTPACNARLLIVLLAAFSFFLQAGEVEHSYGVIIKLIDKHRYRDALIESSRLLKQNPTDDTALVLRARALMSSGSVKAALKDLDRAASINPKCAEAYFYRTQIYFAVHAYQRAMSDAKRAVELKPAWGAAHSALGVLKYYTTDDLEGGINELNLAVKLEPKDADAWMNRGAVFFKLGHLERAKHDLDRSVQLNPINEEALNTRGRVFHALKNYEQAIENYDRAIKLRPDKSDWFNNKALSLVRLNRLDEAIKWYTKAIEIDPSDASACSNRGAAFMRKGQNHLAEIDFKRAIALNPGYASAHSNLASLYVLKGKIEQAKFEVDKASELDPTDAHIRKTRADILARIGAYDESLLDLGAVKKDVRPPTARGVAKVDLENVKANYTRLLKLNPTDKEAFYNRGFVYFCLRDMKASLSDLHEFMRLGGDSRSAINAAILSSLAHEFLGSELKVSRKELSSVLRSSPAKLQSYWGWKLATFLNGESDEKSLHNLDLTKTSKTRMRCYLGIHKALNRDRDGALKEFSWIQDYGDSSVDEFDLAMSWFNQVKAKRR